jgi:AcrR family transcriptional regulator
MLLTNLTTFSILALFSMGMVERRQREKQALREEILEAARELFAKEGYENVTMRKIAEKIEYSPTTIYLYFKDKDEIIEQICDQTFALLSRRLKEVVATESSPIECLKMGLKAYINFGIDHPMHYRVALMMPVDREHRHQEESEGRKSFEFLVNAVTVCVEAGLFRETDVMAISQVLWTAIHGVTALMITQRECFPWIERDRLIDMSVDAAVRGFLK